MQTGGQTKPAGSQGRTTPRSTMIPVVAIKPIVRRRPWSAVVLTLAAALCVLVAVQVVVTLARSFNLGFGLVLVLPRVLECGLVTLGLVLVARGLPYRLGQSLHCARCGYQRIEERDRLLINCPECGHHWRLFGGWRTGRPLGNRRLLNIGVLVCIAGLLAVAGRELAARWLAEQMSTGMLIRHVLYAPSDVAVTSWDILGRRKLSRGQTRWLAEDLLRRRLERGALDVRCVEWFHDRLSDASLDADLAARYFNEAADFWLDANAAAPAGRSFEVSVRGVYRGPAIDTPEGRITFAIEGISIELPGPPAEDARTEFERKFRTGPLQLPPQGVGARTVDPLESRRSVKLATASASGQFVGKATIRAVVWVLVGPVAAEDLSWRSAGGHTAPQTMSPQNRAYRRELVREIEIVPEGPN